MAGANSSIAPHPFGPRAAGLSRGIRVSSGAPLSVWTPTRIHGIATCKQGELGLAAEAPSCIYVGPIQTAIKETLEALYRQILIYLKAKYRSYLQNRPAAPGQAISTRLAIPEEWATPRPVKSVEQAMTVFPHGTKPSVLPRTLGDSFSRERFQTTD